MFSLEELFCQLDDFCQSFENRWQQQLIGQRLQRRVRRRQLCLSEIVTILVAFHQQHYRNFKHYYTDHVCVYWRAAFPGLVSKERFVEWLPSALLPLCAYLKHCEECL